MIAKRPLFAAVALLGGLSSTAALAETAGSARQGAEVAGRWCTACHATGVGAKAADAAPSFEEIARDRSPDYIRGFLANPHSRQAMPRFELSRQDIEDLVAYIESLR
ncbi:Cytochrome c, mono- and diheme variants [Tistlia consotensis]|uniref:Cytochrome c, mono-and diheme variants n=1 Tax=Tistlia consotensis USBA 355 TaxID=560819 RepID=A0A1Y6B3V4_9PROT|nr:c-type cytochrome [Tistlia consotensis]SME88022.1 Cytochrome c, mono-and diheme variants [Tistlia consotensis USBA 355]SNR24386.1 Cytochrome c, mono- and diheme variants [Tistlia consotensis]